MSISYFILAASLHLGNLEYDTTIRETYDTNTGSVTERFETRTKMETFTPGLAVRHEESGIQIMAYRNSYAKMAGMVTYNRVVFNPNLNLMLGVASGYSDDVGNTTGGFIPVIGVQYTFGKSFGGFRPAASVIAPGVISFGAKVE